MKTLTINLKVVIGMIALVIFSCSSPTDSEDHSNQTIYFNKLTEIGAEIIIQNVDHETISYFGYSKDSPLKQVEVFKNGKWEMLYWDWCGTGAESQILKKKESTKFVIGLPSNKTKLRVGIYISIDNSEVGEQVWSEEFTVN